MASVKWSEQAIKDVEAISRYIETVSFQYAQEQAQAIYAKARQMQNHPFI